MTDIVFGENLFDKHFDFLVWPCFREGGRIYDLSCSQTPGGDLGVVA